MTQNPFPHTPDALFINDLVLEDAPRGAVTKYLLHIVTNGMAQPIYVPVIVVRGVEEGPVVGITAAVHGNELNGIPVIQQVVAALDPQTLKGTVVGVPGVNIPSLLQRQRRFVDGTDLNHIMPGRADGTVSQVYAYRVFDRIVTALRLPVRLAHGQQRARQQLLHPRRHGQSEGPRHGRAPRCPDRGPQPAR